MAHPQIYSNLWLKNKPIHTKDFSVPAIWARVHEPSAGQVDEKELKSMGIKKTAKKVKQNIQTECSW